VSVVRTRIEQCDLSVGQSTLQTLPRVKHLDRNAFWATVCKTVRPMPSVRCLSCLSDCDVRALWPNGWTNQDETWHAGRTRPWPHCVRWGPSSPPQRGTAPQFSAHICCDQMAAWIKMSLGMPRPRRLCVIWGPRSPSTKGGGEASPKFSAHVYCAKRLDG